MNARYFQSLHPAVAMAYFAAVLLLTLTCMHPVMSVLSLLGAACFSLSLRGGKAVAGTLRFVLPMMALIAAANPLFNHRGVTMLFMLFDQWITLEAVCYGLVSACQLAAVVMWFTCYQEVMTSDKFLFLFGQAAPAASLLITLTLRLIPQLKLQQKQISQTQEMLRGKPKRLTGKINTAVRNLSILLTWSMENAVETADSMKARGFGMRRRTTFHLFRFDSRDARCLSVIAAFGGAVLIARLYGFGAVEYYPRMTPWLLGAGSIAQMAAAAALVFLPSILEGKEKLRWHYYGLRT